MDSIEQHNDLLEVIMSHIDAKIRAYNATDQIAKSGALELLRDDIEMMRK